jgi:hypothetical protein
MEQEVKIKLIEQIQRYIDAVMQMRDNQKNFFKARNSAQKKEYLKESKRLEEIIDATSSRIYSFTEKIKNTLQNENENPKILDA